MFLSVFIGFLNYFVPVVVGSECDYFVTGDSVKKVVAMSFERFMTHFAPIIFSMFVFWHSRMHSEEQRVRYMKRISSKSLSMMDMEYLDDEIF